MSGDHRAVSSNGLGVDPPRVSAVLRTLHPAPPLPLTEPFSAGLSPLLHDLGGHVGGLLEGRRAERVLHRLGSRFTVTVDPEGVSAKALLRTRRLAWRDIEHVEVAGQSEVIARQILGRMADRYVSRLIPIPGVSWLIRKLLGTLTDVLADLVSRPDESIEPVVVAVTTKGRGDLAFDGLLGIVVLLSHGFTVAVLDRAEAHGVLVVREEN